MSERERKINKFNPLLYFEYKSLIKGFNNTDYPSERKYLEYAGPKFVVVSNKGETPLVMIKADLDRALKNMIWLDDGELKLFWKLKPVGDFDFVIREVTSDTMYHYGRSLYLKNLFSDKEIKVDQVGFGYDYFTIHYLHKSELSSKHGVKEYGDLNRTKLTEYLSKRRY